MSHLQVCTQGHRWDPFKDARPSDEERFNRCPVCGASVDFFSLGGATSVSDSGNPTTPMRSPAPFKIDGYEMLQELGHGGTGIVYKARQQDSGQIVALKVLSAGAQASDSARARFRSEMVVVAALNHPNIVRILDVGEQNGVPWFAIEYMDGGSLATSLNGTAMPARYAAELIRTLAVAVQSAHELNLVHRDLKPANVLLTSIKSGGSETVVHLLGTPKIADFGLAKRSDVSTGLTRAGAIMGTPSYMSPEQAEGSSKDVGPAADVWALGAILYECLTGRPPFKHASMLKTLELVRTTEPETPTSIMPTVPRQLEAICLKALTKKQEDRYATAGALAEDLQRFLNGQPVVARPKDSASGLMGWVGRIFRGGDT